MGGREGERRIEGEREGEREEGIGEGKGSCAAKGCTHVVFEYVGSSM